MDSLPNELLLSICGFMSLETLLTLRSVCTELRAASSDACKYKYPYAVFYFRLAGRFDKYWQSYDICLHRNMYPYLYPYTIPDFLWFTSLDRSFETCFQLLQRYHRSKLGHHRLPSEPTLVPLMKSGETWTANSNLTRFDIKIVSDLTLQESAMTLVNRGRHQLLGGYECPELNLMFTVVKFYWD